MQEAMFVGPAARQVFASYHPPAGGTGRVLTVICPPLLYEDQRTHSALRDLAVALAQNGQHVMRFDYQGSGDSFGELAEMAMSDWLDDIAIVEREGREISGSRVVHLVGVRAGALLACRAAVALPAVRRVVVWDPVIDGRDYVRTLSDAQAALCDLHPLLDRAQRRAAMRELGGYVLSERMVTDLRSLDARTYSALAPGMLRVVTTSPEGFPVSGIPCDTISYECEWDSISNEPLVPRPVLERLVECLTRS